MFRTRGIIKLGAGLNIRAVVDPEIGEYYRALIPPYKRVCVPMYQPHLTVLRRFKEFPVKLDKWFDFQDTEVIIQYSPVVRESRLYYWLDAWSDDVADIRHELGLPTYRLNDFSSYHITIGNKK